MSREFSPETTEKLVEFLREGVLGTVGLLTRGRKSSSTKRKPGDQHLMRGREQAAKQDRGKKSS